MKKIIAVIVLFLSFASVVSASSINGDYKGNPIVKVTSAGKVLETDEVPAQIYDGHTVVPISLLRQLGASVVWDQNSYSVDVTLPQQVKSNGSDISKLKIYARIADQYQTTSTLGEIISNLSDNFSFSFTKVNQSYDTSLLSDSSDRLNKAIEDYNTLIRRNQTVIDEAKKFNIDLTSPFYDMLNSYFKALEYYKESLDGLIKYASSRSDSDFYEYLNNQGKGFDETHKTMRTAIEGYGKYMTLIQTY